jgi:hypothetical protein
MADIYSPFLQYALFMNLFLKSKPFIRVFGLFEICQTGITT